MTAATADREEVRGSALQCPHTLTVAPSQLVAMALSSPTAVMVTIPTAADCVKSLQFHFSLSFLFLMKIKLYDTRTHAHTHTHTRAQTEMSHCFFSISLNLASARRTKSVRVQGMLGGPASPSRLQYASRR